ncbi:hypothetical protein K1719_015034 [Acacia pycnantha]|nr:hypothetical protein K1719_015034 [Acacia pycnantha]
MASVLWWKPPTLYAPTKRRAKTAIVVGILNVGVLGVTIISSQIWLKGEARTDTVGIMGPALNILLYGSPQAAMAANSV